MISQVQQMNETRKLLFIPPSYIGDKVYTNSHEVRKNWILTFHFSAPCTELQCQPEESQPMEKKNATYNVSAFFVEPGH